MGIFDRLKEIGGNVFGNIKKLMDGGLIDGIGGSFALMAMANGELKDEEQAAIVDSINNSERLSDYSTEIIAAFEKHLPDAQGGALGKAKIVNAIKKVKPGESANLLVGACVDIGAADGDFDPDERKIAKDICGWLGVDASIFGI